MGIRSGTDKKKKDSSPSYMRSFIVKLLKILTVFFITMSVVVGSILVGALCGFIKSTEPISAQMLTLKGFTSSIYDYKGNFVMSLIGDKNREMVDADEVPQYLKDAFVAIEDKRFYQHNGIDLKRIAGAIVNYVKPSGNTYGGSTITQQVVKNVTGDDEHSIKRKVQEQWRAIDLEKNLTKEQILEVYMNLIYMGENCYGVQSASKVYFGKPVSELSLAQSACLAGITNLPGAYDPFVPNGKENNLKRQKIILAQMLECNFISKEEYDKAINEDVQFIEKGTSLINSNIQPYFVDQVVLDLKKDLISKGYSEELAIKTIYNNGLKIYTTIDVDVQNCIDKVFQDETNFTVVSESKGKPQAAMVILDSKTGEIRGLTGGIGKKEGVPFNRASSTLMQRQPGSTLKPVAVYGPAINERIITPATVIDDVPVYMLGNSKGLYPQNYERTCKGLTTIREGVRRSVNIIAARVWMEHLGADLSLEYMDKVNINRDDERYLSIALGGLNKGVNPLQMAAAYVPFVNNGVYCEPITYSRVEDKDGNIIFEKKAKTNVVYDENAAYLITNILQDVPKRGTSYPYGLVKNGQIESAGKTGTTSDNKDKWYVGYTPYYVAATWYGYDKCSQLSYVEYSRALKVWNKVMEEVHKDLKPIAFEKPEEGLIEKEVCKCSGKTPTELCYNDPRGSMVVKELFLEGTEPADDDVCEVHVSQNICVASKDTLGRECVAGVLCPSSDIETKVYIKRLEPYVPMKVGDPYPADRVYELPSTKCTVHKNNIDILENIGKSATNTLKKKEIQKKSK